MTLPFPKIPPGEDTGEQDVGKAEKVACEQGDKPSRISNDESD